MRLPNRLETQAFVALGTKPYQMLLKESNNLLRNASDPYSIPLGRDDYYLTREALFNKIDPGLLKKKDWYSPQLKVISFKKGRLKLKNTFIKKAYELTVDIEKDKLHVACNCGSQVETLCIHSFKALDRLAWYIGTSYFQQFRPVGLYETAMAHKKHFSLSTSYDGLEIKPKKTLGTAYALSSKPGFDDVTKLLTLPSRKTYQARGEGDVLCYMIVNIRRKDHPPFLVPCMGRLNKEGTMVKGFDQFLTGIQKEHDHLLTDEQKLLNAQCLALYKEAEKLPGRFFSAYGEDDSVDINRYAAYFASWEKLLPLLKNQPYVFTCDVYQKRELKDKPAKSRTQQVVVSAYQPRLSFRLDDKGEFFQLEMNGKLAYIKSYLLPMLFFMQDDENNLYLLASPIDAYIVEWFRKAGSRITVFKEHFKDFEANFLTHLQVHYEVMKIKPFGKRK